MTSGYWTTDAVSPVGDQVSEYNQALEKISNAILAGCSNFEGIAPGFLNALEGTVTGSETVQINTGGAVVDGLWFHCSAAESVTITAATAGNTRIDRIVLRADWASFEVTIHRIAGTDSGSPTVPAITQTAGTTYDITLYQALVDSGGTVTLTDERVWAVPQVDGSTIETSAGALRVKDGGVTNAKLADPYDVYSVLAAPDGMFLTVKDGYITFPIADVHNGKNVVRLTGRVAVTSSSGNITVRVYNVTDSTTVGTITITAGNTIGFTTTITTPTLATNDILRIDVTGKGTGTKGLTVLVKVDKS